MIHPKIFRQNECFVIQSSIRKWIKELWSAFPSFDCKLNCYFPIFCSRKGVLLSSKTLSKYTEMSRSTDSRIPYNISPVYMEIYFQWGSLDVPVTGHSARCYNRKEFCHWSSPNFRQVTFRNNFPQTESCDFDFNVKVQMYLARQELSVRIQNLPRLRNKSQILGQELQYRRMISQSRNMLLIPFSDWESQK